MLCCHFAFLIWMCPFRPSGNKFALFWHAELSQQVPEFDFGDLLDFEITSWRIVVLNYNWFLRVDFLLLLVHRADERFTHLTLDWFMRLKSLSLHSYFKHLLPFLYKQTV